MNDDVKYLKIDEIEYKNNKNINFYDFKKPLIIRGLCKDIPAVNKWNKENLSETFGENKVPVEFFNNEDEFKYSLVDSIKEYSMKEFIQNISNEYLYMGEINLKEFNRSNLFKDVMNPIIDRKSSNSVLFLGNNAGSQTHIHIKDDYILNQIFGEKTLYLFDYNDNINNGIIPGNPFTPDRRFVVLSDEYWQQTFNLNNMDHSKLKLYKVVLKPGDSLFIPPWWWHNAISNGLSCSITKKYKRNDMSYIFKYPKIMLIFIAEFLNCDIIFDFVEEHFKFSLLGYWCILTIFIALLILLSKFLIIFSILYLLTCKFLKIGINYHTILIISLILLLYNEIKLYFISIKDSI